MIVHQHLDADLWGPFKKRLHSGLTVKVHIGTHERGAICVETRDPADTAEVRAIITELAERRHHRTVKARHHLKTQLITRRPAPCRTKPS